MPRYQVVRKREAGAEMAHTRRSGASSLWQGIGMCEGFGQRLSQVWTHCLPCMSSLPFFPTTDTPPEPPLHPSYPTLTVYVALELHSQTSIPLIPSLPPPPSLPYLPLDPALPPDLLKPLPLHLHNQHPPLRSLRCVSRNLRHHLWPRVDMAHAVRYQLRGPGHWDWGGE